MKQVDIRTHTVPNRPRSGNYPAGTVVSAGGGGSSSTIINEGGGMDLAEARRHFLSKTNADTAAEVISFAKGLRILSDLINKIFKKDTEGDLTDTSVMTALRVLQEIADNNEKLKKIFLRKDQEDTTNFLLNLLGGIITDFIQSTDFVSGMMGTGFTIKKNADGTTYAEIDKLLVRMNAYFQMLTIMRTEVGGATMMFNPSGARITVTKVEYIDKVPFYYSDGAAKYYSDGSRAYVQPSGYGAVYRCHFLADDGDTAIQNLFHAGNLARSQSFNIKEGVHEGVSNRFFWRLVTAVGDDWIELSATHCAEGSDIPQEGDVVCQLGDISDPDYQSAIVLSAFGDGAPYMTFYQGINGYSLSGKDIFTIGYDSVKKRCFLRGYGDMYFGDRGRTSYIEYTQEDGLRARGKFLLESGEEIGSKISAMEGQISLKVGKDQLKATGIDIDSKTVKVTASQFLVQDSSGTGIAVFKLVNGKPVLKAENIDVENLRVKHLDGADGSFKGSVSIANGKIQFNTDGSGKLANGGISWNAAGDITTDFTFSIKANGYTLKLDHEFSEFRIYDSSNNMVVALQPYTDIPGYSSPILALNHYSSGNRARLSVGVLSLGNSGKKSAVYSMGSIEFWEGDTLYRGYTGNAKLYEGDSVGLYRTLYFKNGICYDIKRTEF